MLAGKGRRWEKEAWALRWFWGLGTQRVLARVFGLGSLVEDIWAWNTGLGFCWLGDLSLGSFRLWYVYVAFYTLLLHYTFNTPNQSLFKVSCVVRIFVTNLPFVLRARFFGVQW